MFLKAFKVLMYFFCVSAMYNIFLALKTHMLFNEMLSLVYEIALNYVFKCSVSKTIFNNAQTLIIF